MKHAVALSFLAHHAGADEEWTRARAKANCTCPWPCSTRSAVDTRKALASLPPLIKGYLRVGAKFGDGAVVDKKFNTTDVFVVMPVAEMDTRYLEFFGDLRARGLKQVAHASPRFPPPVPCGRVPAVSTASPKKMWQTTPPRFIRLHRWGSEGHVAVPADIGCE